MSTREHSIAIAFLVCVAGCSAAPTTPGEDASAAEHDAGGGRDSGTAPDAGAETDAGAMAPLDAGADAGGGGPMGWVPPPEVDVPALPPRPDYSGAARDPRGDVVLGAGTGGLIVVARETNDAITVLGDCTERVVACVEAGATVDACMTSVPPCTSETPWLEEPGCCPAACVTRYSDLRRMGTAPISAFQTSFFRTPRCVPGVDERVDGLEVE